MSEEIEITKEVEVDMYVTICKVKCECGQVLKFELQKDSHQDIIVEVSRHRCGCT